jgi:hypothetical protein
MITKAAGRAGRREVEPRRELSATRARSTGDGRDDGRLGRGDEVSHLRKRRALGEDSGVRCFRDLFNGKNQGGEVTTGAKLHARDSQFHDYCELGSNVCGAVFAGDGPGMS